MTLPFPLVLERYGFHPLWLLPPSEFGAGQGWPGLPELAVVRASGGCESMLRWAVELAGGAEELAMFREYPRECVACKGLQKLGSKVHNHRI